ncbi:MAG TPA: multicopper oxidase domain-containing protein, partial [Usitatibacter sp.]|nr:multicopper oxidase domain-containing protein [Usitatibacter sp.]
MKFLLLALAMALPACHSGEDTAAKPKDPYDTTRMDFSPSAAVVSAQRHTGSFSKGDAISLGPEVKPLAPEAVKEIQIDITHKVIDLAPGVKYTAWTFGDQVPGPIVRARVGDRIRFSMTNRSDEHMPAASFSTA